MSLPATESPPVTLALDQTRADARADHAGIRRWLWIVAGLVFLMVVVDGATRLTGSGRWSSTTSYLKRRSFRAQSRNDCFAQRFSTSLEANG